MVPLLLLLPPPVPVPLLLVEAVPLLVLGWPLLLVVPAPPAAPGGVADGRRRGEGSKEDDAEVCRFHGAHIALLVLAQAATRGPPAVSRDLSIERTIDSTFLPAKKSLAGPPSPVGS